MINVICPKACKSAFHNTPASNSTKVVLKNTGTSRLETCGRPDTPRGNTT